MKLGVLQTWNSQEVNSVKANLEDQRISLTGSCCFDQLRFQPWCRSVWPGACAILDESEPCDIEGSSCLIQLRNRERTQPNMILILGVVGVLSMVVLLVQLEVWNRMLFCHHSHQVIYLNSFVLESVIGFGFKLKWKKKSSHQSGKSQDWYISICRKCL